MRRGRHQKKRNVLLYRSGTLIRGRNIDYIKTGSELNSDFCFFVLFFVLFFEGFGGPGDGFGAPGDFFLS